MSVLLSVHLVVRKFSAAPAPGPGENGLNGRCKVLRDIIATMSIMMLNGNSKLLEGNM